MWDKCKRSTSTCHEQPSTTWILGRFVLPFTLRVKGSQRTKAA